MPTTWSIKASGGDFTTWQSFNNSGSVSSGDTGSLDDTTATQTSEYQPTTKSLNFYAPPANRATAPSRSAAGSAARLEVSSGNGVAQFNTSGLSLSFEGISFLHTGSYGDTLLYIDGSTPLSTLTVVSCLSFGFGQSWQINGTGTATCVNTAAAHSYSAFRCSASGATMTCYFCSSMSVSGNTGFWNSGGGTQNAYACVHQETSALFNDYDSLSGGDYNVSKDTSAPGSASTKYARSQTGWYAGVSSGSEDFTLAGGFQGWWAANKDAIDRTGWPATTNTDIVGTSRAGVDIDPGCWQTPGGGGGGGATIPIFDHHYRMQRV